MGSAHGGIPDTSHPSESMRPFARRRGDHPGGADRSSPALPPTGAAPSPPAATATRPPAPVSAAGQSAISPAIHPSSQQSKLLDRLCEALRARHYSPRTEESYRHWVKRYIFFFFHNVCPFGKPA